MSGQAFQSQAFQSYAGKVDSYVAGRPEYPAAMLRELPDVAFAIDVGAGTGLSTAFIAPKAESVLAVEPIASMAQRIPRERLANVTVVVAKAEAIPLSNGAAGLIYCGTAFHWFDYAAAMAEFTRLLAPGGALALVWNVRDSRVPWVARFDAVMDDYAGDTPRQSTGQWRRIFQDARFAPVASRTYPYRQPMATSGIVDRALSTSFIAALPSAEQDVVRGRIAAIIASEPALAGQSEIDFPYVSELHLFRATGRAA